MSFNLLSRFFLFFPVSSVLVFQFCLFVPHLDTCANTYGHTRPNAVTRGHTRSHAGTRGHTRTHADKCEHTRAHVDTRGHTRTHWTRYDTHTYAHARHMLVPYVEHETCVTYVLDMVATRELQVLYWWKTYGTYILDNTHTHARHM